MKKKIEEIRSQLDSIDKRLVDLLRQRTELSLEIGKIKHKHGIDVFDPGREKAITDILKKMAKPPLSPNMIEDIYNSIFSISRRLQKKKKVAYLGPIGSYTHQAADKIFKYDANLMALPTIEDVFQEVISSRADLGVVPVENSTEGMVTQTLDLMASSSLYISKEIMLSIQHTLLSKYPLGKIRKVFSHAQAIAQCRHWLKVNLPDVKIVETPSTSDAALAACRYQSSAAIASAHAATIYGLDIIAANINDHPDNITRFWVVSKYMASPSSRDKTSFIIAIDNVPGALYKAIGSFAGQSIDLTKIESRPSKKGTWEYIFFIDIRGNLKDKPVIEAVSKLKGCTRDIIILGSYPEGALIS
ncbi:MAG: prephenate dehydratase [Thermodesulfobacteriota bacterium]|nr:prephenate dehydratase [Thermodesulfobacteriota bacterium]